MPKIKMMYRMQKAESGPVKLYIYDDVTAQGNFNWDTWQYDESETSAKHFSKLLDEIEEGTDIELHVNSYGGDVKEGVAIYNLLKQKNCNKTCYIDAMAYSVAYVIAMSCDKIVMGLGSSILIHDMWTVCAGNARELRKQADDLDVLMQSNRQIFLERVNISEEKLIEMMEAETILGTDDCLKYGFCDEVDSKVKVDDAGVQQSYEKRYAQMLKEQRESKEMQESLKLFVQQSLKKEENPKVAPVQQDGPQKCENEALNMMGAFLNAFSSAFAERK